MGIKDKLGMAPNIKDIHRNTTIGGLMEGDSLEQSMTNAGKQGLDPFGLILKKSDRPKYGQSMAELNKAKAKEEKDKKRRAYYEAAGKTPPQGLKKGGRVMKKAAGGTAKREDFDDEMGPGYAKLRKNLKAAKQEGVGKATAKELQRMKKLEEMREELRRKTGALPEKKGMNCGGKVKKMYRGGTQKHPDRLNPGDVNKGGTKSDTKLAGKPLQYKRGGRVCRGMGAATRGGRYGKDG
jgi:hypothetical protein